MGDDSKRSQAERQDSGVGMSLIVTTDYFHHGIFLPQIALITQILLPRIARITRI